jgi:DNA-damage-inducible protein D
LIALNADARILEVSLAKTYFASQTRKLEITEAEIENTKRLKARQKLKESETEIEETIYNR